MIRNIFGSINKSIVIIIIVIVLLVLATLFERELGSQVTLQLFYHSWWLWCLLIFGVISAIYQVFVLRKPTFSRIYSTILHGSFVFIICGAIVTHLFSQEAFLMLRTGEKSIVMVNEYQEPVAKLPFSVKLEQFTVERYGGSGMPSNYISDIVIDDGDRCTEFTVSMNNIVRYGNYKLYQSSYDDDELGSVLMINDDYWGSLITYIGYALLMLGMVLIFFSRQSRFKQLLKRLTIIIVICSATLSAEAQVTAQNIKEISHIAVQASSGRIEPLSTFANNVLQKLYKEKLYHGVRGEVIVMDILSGNIKWQYEPIIKLESEDLQKYLNKNSLYVSYSEFYSPSSGYILTDILNKIYQKSQGKLSRRDKELLKLDERINIIYQLYAQKIPAIIPISGTSQKWLSLAEAKHWGLTKSKSAVEFEKLVRIYGNSPSTEVLNGAIDSFTQLQTAETVVENRVSRRRLACEAWYNNFNILLYTAILVIIMGIMGIVTFIMGSRERRPVVKYFEKIVKCGVLFGILSLLFYIALRWYVAGRVPMSNSYETLLSVSLTLLIGGWLFRRVSILIVSATSFVAGCFIMISYVGALDPQITPLVPILNSHWLLFHVATIAVSYGLFALSAILGIIYMILKIIAPKSGNIDSISIKMTALNELSQIIGVLFLTIGIFLGAIWANVSWGRYWGWDPKETWALITMFAYVVNIHLFISKRYYSKFLINTLSIFSIGLVLMTFFGVNYFFGGMHAYGGDYSFPIIWIGSVVLFLIVMVVVARARIYKRKYEK